MGVLPTIMSSQNSQNTQNSQKKSSFQVPIIPKIESPSRLGLIVLIVFLGGFLLWASIFKLESAAVASGKIVVESHRKTIQHLEGGIVDKIFVEEGQNVQAGQVLIELDQTRPKANLELIEGQTNMLLAREASLKATRDRQDHIVFPQRLLQRAQEPAIKEILDQATKDFDSRKKTLDDGTEILKNRIIQLKSEIDSLKAKADANDIQLNLINEELNAWADLEKQSYVDKPKVLALKREAARLEGEKNENLALIARAKQKINETELQVSNLVDTQESDVLKQLGDTEFNIASNLEKERAARDIFEHTLITSPIAGTVLNLQIHTIGGVITPGEALMDIVPHTAKLIVEARIRPNDIDVVHAGLLSKIRLTAYKQRITPTIEGKVDSVSADLLYDEKANIGYYNARISVNESELKRLKDITLYPGMPVQVYIITATSTPLNYLIRPILDSFSNAFREK